MNERINELPKTSEELLKEAKEFLEEASFKFAAFVSAFQRAIERLSP